MTPRARLIAAWAKANQVRDRLTKPLTAFDMEAGK